jgi:hypothetical protein
MLLFDLSLFISLNSFMLYLCDITGLFGLVNLKFDFSPFKQPFPINKSLDA